NSYYEPWFFLPAAAQLGQQERWHLAIVESVTPQQSTWLAFFPFVRKASGGLSLLSLWNHSHCFLTTPLIRQDSLDVSLETLMLSLQHDSTLPGLLELSQISATGAIQQALVDVERRLLLSRFVRSTHNRALLSRERWRDADDDGQQYIADCLGGHHARELRRQRRRLGERGDLEFRQLTHLSQVDLWTDWFLELEDSGWKGRSGTSMKQHPEEEAFFREMTSTGFAERRIEMMGLFCQGEPIALKCNLLADAGSFSFKIAFNEELARFSPGVLLELDHIQKFAASGRDWMDSCAVAEHKMINRLWSDRRTIQDILISTGRSGSELQLASLPLLRVLYRQIKRCGSAVRQAIPFLRTNS
ncbi:MAG: GNAT family N-acetyltransferase, partial [Planctomycetaceae bacterium]|nr:GNAT family N-acetyltransferase [Planctomycetaceae bacterium]